MSAERVVFGSRAMDSGHVLAPFLPAEMWHLIAAHVAPWGLRWSYLLDLFLILCVGDQQCVFDNMERVFALDVCEKKYGGKDFYHFIYHYNIVADTVSKYVEIPSVAFVAHQLSHVSNISATVFTTVHKRSTIIRSILQPTERPCIVHYNGQLTSGEFIRFRIDYHTPGFEVTLRETAAFRDHRYLIFSGMFMKFRDWLSRLAFDDVSFESIVQQRSVVLHLDFEGPLTMEQTPLEG